MVGSIAGIRIKRPVSVSFKDGVNHAGIHQKACVGCGDCVTGCNFVSKNTTLMNYLAMTHDTGPNKIYLKDDRVRIDWENVGKQPIFFFSLFLCGRVGPPTER